MASCSVSAPAAPWPAAARRHVCTRPAQALQHVLMKVETHNHPTAISPFPGAATGAGGEIRDEGATGRGSRPKAGLTGFSVSKMDLDGKADRLRQARAHCQRLADHDRGPAWAARRSTTNSAVPICWVISASTSRPPHPASTPCAAATTSPSWWLAAWARIDAQLTHKMAFPAGSLLIQLGGPGMRIGLGGSAASSMATGTNATALDFDSVQRDNPEMQRRAQEVINHCQALGEANPVLAIHDVGAGGLSNAFPELTNDAGRGARFDLRAVPLDESGMSPREIWCNESQERYVLAIAPESLAQFAAFCARERCPYAVVGVATEERELSVLDALGATPVAMPMDVLLGKPPKMQRDVQTVARRFPALDLSGCRPAARGDRRAGASDGGIQALPDHHRRPHRGWPDAPRPDGRPLAGAGGRLRGDAGRLPRLRAARPWPWANARRWRWSMRRPRAAWRWPRPSPICWPRRSTLSRVKLSANWMAACGEPGEDADLYATVRAVGMELCPALGISIPVGKDSLSMRTQWVDPADKSAAQGHLAGVADRQRVCDAGRRARHADAATRPPDGRHHAGAGRPGPRPQPHGRQHPGADAGAGRRRRCRTWTIRRTWCGWCRRSTPCAAQGLLLAYHDRSDGGLFATVCEMAFAGKVGVALNVDMLVTEGDGISDSRAEYGDSKNWAAQVQARRDELTLKALFNEELGVVLQIRSEDRDAVMQVLREHGLSRHSHCIGKTRPARLGHQLRCRRDPGLARREAGVCRAAARPAPGLGLGQLEDLPSARQPGQRRRRTCGSR